MMKLPFLVSAALIAAMPGAWAGDSASPLPAGKPAGLNRAQLDQDGNGMLLVAGLALVGITIALATSSNDVAQPTGTMPGGSVTTSSTGGTNP